MTAPRTCTTQDLLTEAEAAALLRIKPETLRHWRTNKRHKGKAPAFVQQGKGRVLYLRSDLLAWIERNHHQPKRGQ